MISLRLNGKITSYDGDPQKSLLRALQEDFGLTAARCGCEGGWCGACNVILNGHLTHSCLVSMGQAAGGEVITLEGLRETPHFEVLATAFDAASVDPDGFALPGLILTAHCILMEHPDPTEEQIRQGLAGSRCPTGYSGIVKAIQRAGKEGNGLW